MASAGIPTFFAGGKELYFPAVIRIHVDSLLSGYPDSLKFRTGPDLARDPDQAYYVHVNKNEKSYVHIFFPLVTRSTYLRL
jgi:hypothetical protein